MQMVNDRQPNRTAPTEFLILFKSATNLLVSQRELAVDDKEKVSKSAPANQVLTGTTGLQNSSMRIANYHQSTPRPRNA